MKILLNITILMMVHFVYSQNFIVVDSLTKEPLPYATIKTENGGVYTNENGIFLLNEKTKEVQISYMGYYDFISDVTNLKDSVFLTPKTIILKEITIAKNNSSSQKIGFLKKAKQITSLPLNPKGEIIICLVPNPKYINSYIEQIEFPLNRVKHYNKKDKLYKNAPAVVRINIYTLENNLPKEKIYSSVPIKFIMSEREKILLDLSDEMIQLTENGVCFGIEMIGRINDKGEFVEENSYTRPILTDQESKEYKAITYSTSSILKSKNELYPINKINENLVRDIKKYKPQNYNLAIGLVIKKAIEN